MKFWENLDIFRGFEEISAQNNQLNDFEDGIKIQILGEQVQDFMVKEIRIKRNVTT